MFWGGQARWGHRGGGGVVCRFSIDRTSGNSGTNKGVGEKIKRHEVRLRYGIETREVTDE